MNKLIWVFFGIGLIVVAIVVSMSVETSKGSHLELNARMMHVRTLPANPKATIVIVDFHAANPSDISFQANTVEMRLDGVADAGQIVSKHDLDNIFEYMKQLGPKFNPPFGTGDYVRPHSEVDGMVAARFEVPERVAKESTLHVTLEEMGRTVVELKAVGAKTTP